MTAITAHGTPVLAETAWYLALASEFTRWRAIGAKFRVNLALAQRFAFAAVRALMSVIDVLGVVVVWGEPGMGALNVRMHGRWRAAAVADRGPLHCPRCLA